MSVGVPAPGNYPLRLVQFGKETTAGTLVAATHKAVGDATYSPNTKRYIPKFPLGVRAPYSSGGIATMKTSEIDFKGDLTYEDILDALQVGVIGVASPTGGAPANDVYALALTGSPTGGNFTLTVTIGSGGPQTTANINSTATAAQVQAALVALSNEGSGNVTATGTALPTGPITITHTGANANTAVTITGTGAGLTPSGAVSLTHSTPGVAGYVWTFTPNIAGAPNLATMTCEYVIRDGTNNWYCEHFGYAVASEIDLDLTFGQEAKLNYKLFGQAETALGSPTGSLSPYASREIASAMASGIWVDSTWAGLGTTKLSTTVRSIKLNLKTGFAPDYTLDGRTNLDFSQVQWGRPEGKIECTFEHNGTAQTELAHWRPNQPDQRFFQIAIPSPLNPGKNIVMNLSARYFEAPKFSQQNDVELVTLQADLDYDLTSSNLFQFIVTNAQATWT